MINLCKNNLLEIRSMLQNINPEIYNRPAELLSRATIGAHTRHILEFYICLINGAVSGTICYDNRERRNEIETDLKFAIYTIDKINSQMPMIPKSDQTTLLANYDIEFTDVIAIPTSLNRELAYCLEHSIHHQALMVVALKEFGLSHTVTADFGVGTATIKYKKQCVQ